MTSEAPVGRKEVKRTPRKERKAEDPRLSVWEMYSEEASANFENKEIPKDLLEALMTWAYIRHQSRKGEIKPEDAKVLQIEFNEGWGAKLEEDESFRKAVTQITKRTQVLTGIGFMRTN